VSSEFGSGARGPGHLPVYTGRWEFPVHGTLGWPIGLAEFVLRRDVLEVWYTHRCVAVVDRRRLRAWIDRTPSLRADDVTWTARIVDLAVSFGSMPPHPLPPELADVLRHKL